MRPARFLQEMRNVRHNIARRMPAYSASARRLRRTRAILRLSEGRWVAVSPFRVTSLNGLAFAGTAPLAGPEFSPQTALSDPGTGFDRDRKKAGASAPKYRRFAAAAVRRSGYPRAEKIT